MKFWAHSKRWKPIWSAHSMPRSSSSRFVKQRKISDEGKGWWKQKPVDKGRRRDARQRRERRHDVGHKRMRRALQRRRQPRPREQRRSISTAAAAAAAATLHCTARHCRRRRHSGVASEMCQAGTNQQPMGMSALTRDAGAPWNKAVVCGPIEATNAAAQHGGSARRLLGSVGQRVRQGGPEATGQG